jgi:predicted enzyme related to lactoylglutathione lyase
VEHALDILELLPAVDGVGMTEADISTFPTTSQVLMKARSADQAKAFLADLFGWEFGWEFRDASGHARHHVSNTATAVVVHDDDDEPPAALGFSVERPIEYARRISQLGGRISRLEALGTSEDNLQIGCLDPWGTGLEFFTPDRPSGGDPPARSPAGEFALAILAEDATLARSFYQSLVGSPGMPATSNYLEVMPHVFLVNAPEAPDRLVFYFQVDDLGAMAERVNSLGGKSGELFRLASFVCCECTDDQETTFGICQPTDKP